jgi:uncharacterized hydrophobic protein (TIGR00271 family)
MRLIEGELPTENLWRVLVLVSAAQPNVVNCRLAQAIARANKGYVMFGVYVVDDRPESLDQARTVGQALVENCDPHDKCVLLIYAVEEEQIDMRKVVARAEVDMLLIDTESGTRGSWNNLPCTVAALRGSHSSEEIETRPIHRILIPTAGGPATVEALKILRTLPEEYELDVLYVARAAQAGHELTLGRNRMLQMLQTLDAEDRVDIKVIASESVTEGILNTVAEGYDLVVIGATSQSGLDRFLFGDIVNAVVRESKTPVIVTRQPAQPMLGSALTKLDYQLQRVIPHLSISERSQVYMSVRRNSRPDLDYYVLITLSAAIAALGLLQNSAAVVIGAMLVAPLMSPIVGAGMAIVLGDLRFLRFTLGSALRGMVIVLIVGFLLGLVAADSKLTSEILNRTQPGFIDLLIALFSGLAGSFAIVYSGAAAALPGVAIAAALVPPLASSGLAFSQGNINGGIGALLLFITNFIAISSAATLVFLLFGFRPKPNQKARRAVQQRTTRLALIMLVGIGIFLSYVTFTLAQDNRTQSEIRQIVTKTVVAVDNIFENDSIETDQLELKNFGNASEPLTLDLTVRSTQDFSAEMGQALNDVLGELISTETSFEGDVVLELTVIKVTKPEPYHVSGANGTP